MKVCNAIKFMVRKLSYCQQSRFINCNTGHSVIILKFLKNSLKNVGRTNCRCYSQCSIGLLLLLLLCCCFTFIVNSYGHLGKVN